MMHLEIHYGSRLYPLLLWYSCFSCVSVFPFLWRSLRNVTIRSCLLSNVENRLKSRLDSLVASHSVFTSSMSFTRGYLFIQKHPYRILNQLINLHCPVWSRFDDSIKCLIHFPRKFIQMATLEISCLAPLIAGMLH